MQVGCTFRRGVWGLFALLLLTSQSVRSEELRFDRLFVIGDSLSDGGTYSQSAIAGSNGSLPPNIRYRFTTNNLDGSSRTYAGFLAQSLGIDLEPNIISGVKVPGGQDIEDIRVGGTNFAQGGARISNPEGENHRPDAGITTLPLRDQISQLLATKPNFRTGDLVIVWGGANDVFFHAKSFGDELAKARLAGEDTDAATGRLTMSAIGNITGEANNLIAGIDRLKAAGAGKIIVMTVPDLDKTPGGQLAEVDDTARALLNALGGAFNARLLAEAQAKNFLVLDSRKILNAVLEKPVRYGFDSNAASALSCLESSLLCTSGAGGNAGEASENLIFADLNHPTTTAHALLGQAVRANLVAVAQTAAISVMTLTALRQQALSLETRLTPHTMFTTDKDGKRIKRPVGDIDAFLTLKAGTYTADAQQVFPGLDNRTVVSKVGFDVPATADASVGLELGIDLNQADFDGNRGGFDSRHLTGTVFGQMALNEVFYLNATAGGGRIDVHDINRRFMLGSALESYSADSEGEVFFARIGGGALFPLTDTGHVWLNPFGHYTYETVSIDGFTEQGLAGLAFGDVRYDAYRLTGGLSLLATPEATPHVTFNLRGSVEYDLKDDDLVVSLGPTETARVRISSPRPGGFWGYISASATIDLDHDLTLNVSASGSLGLNGTNGYVGSASLNLPF